jgi:hypothetical protein
LAGNFFPSSFKIPIRRRPYLRAGRSVGKPRYLASFTNIGLFLDVGISSKGFSVVIEIDAKSIPAGPK